jgi:hypothetical protein
VIHLRYDLAYPAALRGTHAQEGPGGRHQQWRINPMTGDISNDGTKMFVRAFLALNKIELVTADFITRCCPAG